MNPHRYHTQVSAPTSTSLKSAFDKCLALLQEHGSTEMALALPSKVSLVGVVSEVLGAEAVRALDRDNTHLRKGIVMHLLTEKIQRRRMQGPVVAAFLDPMSLERVVAAAGVTGVVFVPEQANDLAAYLNLYPESVAIESLADRGTEPMV